MTRALDRTGDGDSWRRVTDALTAASGPGRTSGKWTKFACPAHEDKDPSLGASYNPAKGKTKIQCFAGCDDTAVLAAIGLTVRDLFDHPLEDTTGRKRPTSSNGLVDLSTPRPAPRPAPRTATATAAGKRKSEQLGKVIATYTYLTAAGEPCGQVLRYEPKSFRPRRWNPQSRRWVFGGFEAILYRLPQVAAAIAVGEPVYLVEGEKDADTAVHKYEITATTNASGGGAGHFLPAHAEQLRGADVVIVADRDPTGYGHAETVTALLDGIAKSVRVVQARTGKDLTDHYTAGHALADLDEVDLRTELRLIRGGKDDDDSGQPPTGGGSGTTDDDIPNFQTKYRHRLGQTVRVDEKRKRTDPSRYKVVWNCEASMVDELVTDNGDPDVAPVRHAVRLSLRRQIRDRIGAVVVDDNGQPQWEQTDVLLPGEKINDGSWPDCLPWPGLLASRSRVAKDAALEAASLVPWVGRSTQMQRYYTALGWRTDKITGQHSFVTAGGLITPDGFTASDAVDVPAALRVIDPPPPTTDTARLHEAVAEGLLPLLDLPARVAAPLIGFSFRGMVSPPMASIHVAGLRGTGKSAVVRCCALHWLAPSMHQDGVKQMSSGRSDSNSVSDTLKGLVGNLYAAAGAPFLIDDFKGRASMNKLDEIQNAVWNHSSQTSRTRSGGSRTQGAPRAAVITTGEKATTGSSATRALTIDLRLNDLTAGTGLRIDDLFEGLESETARAARGLIGSSFIQWLATHRTERMRWVEQLEEHSAQTRAWRQIVSQLPQDEGVQGRLAITAKRCSSGWALLLSYLLDAELLSPSQADGIWEWAMSGIAEELRAQDATSADGPAQMLELLRGALATGSCHLSTKSGHAPTDVHHENLIHYGWNPKVIGRSSAMPDGSSTEWVSRGDRVGWIDDNYVYLNPAAVMSVVLAAAARADHSFSESTYTLGADMAARGWIDNTRGPTSPHRSGGVVVRYWQMHRDIFDSHDPDTTGPDEPDAPLPPPPWSTTGAAATPEPAATTDPDSVDSTGSAEDADMAASSTTRPDDAMVRAFELHAPERPCVVCGEPTTGQLTGRPAHLPCALDAGLSLTPEPDPEPTQPTPAAEPVVVDVDVDEPAADVDDGPVPPADVEPTSVSAGAPTDRPAPAADRWAAAAAVVTADHLVFPDGSQTPLGDDIAHLGDLAALGAALRLGHGGGKHVLPSAGQLYLTEQALERFGIRLPARLEITDAEAVSKAIGKAGKSAAAAAIADGWKLSNDDVLRVHTRIWRPRTDTVSAVSLQLIVVPLVAAFDHSTPLIADDPSPAALARRAQLVADTLGVTWGASGGVTGLNLLRQLRPPRVVSGRAPLAVTEFNAPPAPLTKDPARVPNTALLWCRPTGDDEAGHEWLHGYDVNAMYLAAQGAAEVGIGASIHHRDGTAFNAKTAGLWRIEPGAGDDWRLPDVTRPGGVLAGTTAWYSTPTLRYLIEELGQTPEILEAYTWETSRRYFDRWYETVRDARAAMMTAAAAGDADATVLLPAIKQVYKSTIGRFGRFEDGRAKSPLYRPDWRLTIIATANVTLLRKLRRAGLSENRWPVGVSTDEVLYTSTDSDPVASAPSALRLGDGMGQFKVARSVRLTEEIRRALGTRRIGQALTAIHDGQE